MGAGIFSEGGSKGNKSTPPRSGVASFDSHHARERVRNCWNHIRFARVTELRPVGRSIKTLSVYRSTCLRLTDLLDMHPSAGSYAGWVLTSVSSLIRYRELIFDQISIPLGRY
jgi:hypothetical protein